jgi:NitT/TauT family transport system substrate-binding protein
MKGIVKLRRLWALAVLVLLAGCEKQETKQAEAGLTSLTLQLCWLPQSEFMGFYVAADAGFYRDEGLDVTLVPGGGEITEVSAVSSGLAQIGITPPANLMIAVAEGFDLVQIGQIYQQSALVLVAKKESGIRSGADFTAATKIGNWGIGYEYELFALLQKYNLPLTFINQDFTMNGFDSGELDVASAMVYNELGLVKNSYEGALGYGDNVNVIDMDEEGVSMLGDTLFTGRVWAEANRETLVKFLRASIRGWKKACEDTDAAAEVVFKAGSSVSMDHQKYMARQVAQLVTVNSEGRAIELNRIGQMDDKAILRTMEIAKKYAGVSDSQVNARFQALSIDDIRVADYWQEAVQGLE